MSKRTIDYYTQLGLLAAERSDSGYRLYASEDVDRLHYIECLKMQRFTLEEIRELLKDRTCSIADIRSEMRMLEHELDVLSEKTEHKEKEKLKIELSRRLFAMATLLLQF